MAVRVDLHIRNRLRRRRRLLGLTQAQLAERIGIKAQQVQKYECGENRITAARLYELAQALHVPIAYFFEGLDSSSTPANDRSASIAEVPSRDEALELIRVFQVMNEPARQRLLGLAKSLEEDVPEGAY